MTTSSVMPRIGMRKKELQQRVSHQKSKQEARSREIQRDQSLDGLLARLLSRDLVEDFVCSGAAPRADVGTCVGVYSTWPLFCLSFALHGERFPPSSHRL
mmetsp:Transcript_22542/g.36300  ORF Transcript_22542/g.36300 Transcript_22542/m.36300 type:complete len:100 (+) Transcript_22542:199-498(+)